MLSSDIPSALGPSDLPPAPAGIDGALVTAVRRSLQRLPDKLLLAMVRGLRSNADDLAPGALFRRRDGGGCAVGVTLRELAPDAFQFGRIEFWLWRRWRRGVEADVARRFPQLQQLQRLFDDAVREIEEISCDGQAAKAVGLWFAASAEAELQARDTPARATRWPANLPTRGSRRPADQTRRGQVRAVVTERHSAEKETLSCS